MKTKLKEIRISKGISQFELSTKSGVQQDAISGYENGKRIPQLDTAQKIASALGVTIDAIWPVELEVAGA